MSRKNQIKAELVQLLAAARFGGDIRHLQSPCVEQRRPAPRRALPRPAHCDARGRALAAGRPISRRFVTGAFSLVLAAAVLVACSPDEPLPFSLDGQYSEADIQTMKRAYAVLLKECPPLARKGNVESVRAAYTQPFNPDRTTMYGWRREIRFLVKIMGWPHQEMMPGAGRLLHIGMGGGTRPGIVASKDGSKIACRLPKRPGHDTFRPVPALLFVGK